MNHLRALDANLEPVDVEQGEFHSGPQCAICHDFTCEHCGNFDTEECPGISDDFEILTVQLHRYAELAARTQAALDAERNLRREAEKAAKRFETAAANEHRGHALAEANTANALYREKLAQAQIATLHAELTELRNREDAP